MDFLYTLMILAIIFFSVHLTHSNKKYIYYVYLFSTIFGLFSLLTFIIFIVDVTKGFLGLDTCTIFTIQSLKSNIRQNSIKHYPA